MPGLWQTVCGKVEANESSIEACRRETKEETGLDLGEGQKWRNFLRGEGARPEWYLYIYK